MLRRIFRVATVAVLILTSGCVAFAFRSSGYYSGRLIDAETGKPIGGAVILGAWFSRSFLGEGSEFYTARETTSDEKGEFRIITPPAVLAGVLPNGRIFADEMYVIIFKTGYEHIGLGPWDSFKIDDILGEKIRWEGPKAIIPLRKLTAEERRKRYLPDPGQTPEDQCPLLIEEMTKETKETRSQKSKY